MKSLALAIILNLLFGTTSCRSDTVLICMGTSSYAYHDHYCEGLTQCHAGVKKVNLETAKSMKRSPCHYCYKAANSVKPIKTTVPPSTPMQCTAITKKGTRCSRKARSNGHCWQHGG